MMRVARLACLALSGGYLVLTVLGLLSSYRSFADLARLPTMQLASGSPDGTTTTQNGKHMIHWTHIKLDASAASPGVWVYDDACLQSGGLTEYFKTQNKVAYKAPGEAGLIPYCVEQENRSFWQLLTFGALPAAAVFYLLLMWHRRSRGAVHQDALKAI